MKKIKLVKMIAMVMVMVMMLSTSVFAAGNGGVDEGIEMASMNGYYSGDAEDTFTFNYGDDTYVTTYVTFTVKCHYGVYLPEDGSSAYYDFVQFDEITGAKICDVTNVTMNRLYSSAYGDETHRWMDYEMGTSGYKYRVHIVCGSLGDIDYYAEALY